MARRTPLHSLDVFDLISDPALGLWFKDRETWAAWWAFLAALFALPMTAEQEAIYRDCTGRSVLPSAAHREAWLICGRRSGKSFTMALIAVFLACCREWRAFLAPGERATIMVVARDRDQAREILNYVKAYFAEVPMLARLMASETAESVELTNMVRIQVNSASYTRTRGFAIAVAICDEMAFWPTDATAANPDEAILKAIRPGQVQFGDQAMLLCASSPYAKRGELYRAYEQHYARDGDPVLVWQAPTRRTNPTISQAEVDSAMERDPADAMAEYGAQFRDDISGLLSLEAINACVAEGVRERGSEARLRGQYLGFLDVAGGSGSDSAALAIGHKEGRVVVFDCVVERKPPFSPEAITEEFSDVMRRFGVSKAHADRWGSDWVVEAFRKRGVYVVPSEKPKADLYQNLIPAVNSRFVHLLDHPRSIHQLATLERRTGPSGKDIIDHPKHGHDDVANVIAGLAFHALRAPGQLPAWVEEDRALGRQSSCAPDDDPLADFSYSGPQPKVRLRRANEWRWKDPGTHRWDTVAPDDDPLEAA
jgi:hypothetical protein